MSQILTPLGDGVVPNIQTSGYQSRLRVLSQQYVEEKKLQSRPTEWVADGRPIYRRLPATSETYQVDFFNIVKESNILANTRNLEGIEEVGYVYIPYGESINGVNSIEVVAADGNQALLIKGGNLVWRYGKTTVLPTIVDLSVLDVGVGKWDLAYQLVYDDSPIPSLYSVDDFALTGFPLDITASTDSVIGWRYASVNAFLNTDTLFWTNSDTYFPTSAQPASSYLQWGSELAHAYSKVTLRCPPGTAYSGYATLYYITDAGEAEAVSVEISSDNVGQFFEFSLESPTFQNAWKVSFSSLEIAIQAVAVSGTLTLLEPQAGPSPRATLVMYPAGTLPPTVQNSIGAEVPAAYCVLAEVDVDKAYQILDVNDVRSIIHRDYTPVADWLTLPFDQDLISLYEQVSNYSELWMTPPTSLKQEYTDLSSDQIIVEE
jgi:hypothetical protein